MPDLPIAARHILTSLRCELIEEKDIYWLTTLADTQNEGPVREEIRRLRDRTLDKFEHNIRNLRERPTA